MLLQTLAAIIIGPSVKIRTGTIKIRATEKWCLREAQEDSVAAVLVL